MKSTFSTAARRAVPLLAMIWALAAFAVTAPAYANLCDDKKIDPVHEAEARELESQAYSTGSNCAAGSTSCYIGTRDYNARVIACNRTRDVKPFSLGPINDLPGVHKAAGKHLDDRSAADRRFSRNLPPRMISGQMQYFGAFPKRYGYILERESGNWITTVILDFNWPKAERRVVHLPYYLISRLSASRGGASLSSTLCGQVSSRNRDEGLVRVDWGGGEFDYSCRINRERPLFLVDDGDRTDLDYIDEGLGFTRSRPVEEWIMHYWRAVLENVWTRPNGSFQLKVLIANLAGQPGEMDEDDVKLYEKNDVVFKIEMHHNQNRSTYMYRPVKVAGVKIYKAIYAGGYPSVVAHEFGHSLGLDDEYASAKNPKADQNCHSLTGAQSNSARSYAMCDDWDMDGITLEPTEVYNHNIKSLYTWIITQRYSIGNDIEHCKEDSQCRDGQYCKKPILGVNRCVALKAEGANCTADKQCAGGAVCKPKPFGKCIFEGSKQMGERCVNNKECATGQCDKGTCRCRNDDHCRNNQFCNKGTATIGANSCEAKRRNDQSCSRKEQCLSGRCYVGRCKPHDECSKDTDCSGSQYCDKGTLTVGVNQCVAKKRNDQSCTRKDQCQSGRCYLGKCKPQDECSKDTDCSGSQYCDKGTLTVGVNQCVAKKSNGKGCTRKEQCQSNRCNVGFCAEEKECSKDNDCANNEYCDKGTAGIGKNECKRKKSQGTACSRKAQCSSGCCKVHNFKMQCRPSNKCN